VFKTIKSFHDNPGWVCGKMHGLAFFTDRVQCFIFCANKVLFVFDETNPTLLTSHLPQV
jgi:hypothetical protein